MDTTRKIVKNLLLAFVLISVGFALGKNSIKKGNNATSDSVEVKPNGKYVAVYYMHSTFRCVSCNTIEKMTKSLLDKDYAEELKDGRIKWREVDFQDNEALAEQFKVISSCVVVASVSNGKYTDYKRLDEVWTLMKDPPAFDKYISKAIDPYLKVIGGEK